MLSYPRLKVILFFAFLFISLNAILVFFEIFSPQYLKNFYMFIMFFQKRILCTFSYPKYFVAGLVQGQIDEINSIVSEWRNEIKSLQKKQEKDLKDLDIFVM